MGKALDRYAGSQAQQRAAPPTAQARWQCMCHGCPVTAGIEAGADSVICRFHHGAAPSEWAGITTRLRNREWMVRIADYCAAGTVAPGWAARAAAAAENAGRPDLKPDRARRMPSGAVRDEAEHPLLYAQRINSVLAGECVVERKAPPLPMVRDRSTDAVRVSNVLPSLA